MLYPIELRAHDSPVLHPKTCLRVKIIACWPRVLPDLLLKGKNKETEIQLGKSIDAALLPKLYSNCGQFELSRVHA